MHADRQAGEVSGRHYSTARRSGLWRTIAVQHGGRGLWRTNAVENDCSRPIAADDTDHGWGKPAGKGDPPSGDCELGAHLRLERRGRDVETTVREQLLEPEAAVEATARTGGGDGDGARRGLWNKRATPHRAKRSSGISLWSRAGLGTRAGPLAASGGRHAVSDKRRCGAITQVDSLRRS